MKKEPLTDEEILQLDFYDFLGSWSIFYTDEEKIEYYRNNIENISNKQ